MLATPDWGSTARVRGTRPRHLAVGNSGAGVNLAGSAVARLSGCLRRLQLVVVVVAASMWVSAAARPSVPVYLSGAVVARADARHRFHRASFLQAWLSVWCGAVCASALWAADRPCAVRCAVWCSVIVEKKNPPGARCSAQLRSRCRARLPDPRARLRVELSCRGGPRLACAYSKGLAMGPPWAPGPSGVVVGGLGARCSRYPR